MRMRRKYLPWDSRMNKLQKSSYATLVQWKNKPWKEKNTFDLSNDLRPKTFKL